MFGNLGDGPLKKLSPDKKKVVKFTPKAFSPGKFSPHLHSYGVSKPELALGKPGDEPRQRVGPRQHWVSLPNNTLATALCWRLPSLLRKASGRRPSTRLRPCWCPRQSPEGSPSAQLRRARWPPERKWTSQRLRPIRSCWTSSSPGRSRTRTRRFPYLLSSATESSMSLLRDTKGSSSDARSARLRRGKLLLLAIGLCLSPRLRLRENLCIRAGRTLPREEFGMRMEDTSPSSKLPL